MQLILITKRQETKSIWSFVFKNDSPVKWKAGQYLIYFLSHEKSDLRGKMRFFTISAAPFEKNITLTTRIDVKKGSSFKNALLNLKVGDKIQAKGPDGDFIIKIPHKKYVFIAGGIGITPFRSILKQNEFKNIDLDIILFYANKNKQIAFKQELDQLKFNRLKIKYLIGKKINTDALINIKDYKKRIFYISGPDAMVEEILSLLSKLEIDQKNIKEDYFSGYQNTN